MTNPNHAPQNFETGTAELPEMYRHIGEFPTKWASQQGLEAVENLPEYKEFDDV